MPRAYTACRSGCALLPSVHVELKKRKIIKKRGSRESFDETIIKKYDFIEESMGHRTKRILRIERKEYQTY